MNTKSKKFVSVTCIVLVMVLLVTLVLSAIGSSFAVSQSEINALKNQQAAINQQKNDLQSKIGNLEAEKTSAIEMKTVLDQQNELARQEIELINEQIDLYDKLIEQKEKELEEAKQQEAEQKAALRVRMRAMEENGEVTYFAILFRATDFSDLLSRLDFISEIMEHDKKLEDSYIAARENVEKVKAEYEETQTEQQATRVELEAKKAELEKQIEEAIKVITDLENDIAELEEEYEANAAQESAIRAELDKKIAQFEKEQEELRKQQLQQSGSTTVVTGSGAFTWPTPGYTTISSPYGYRPHPIFGDQRFHSGVDIAAPSGATIVAADSGTVITAVYSSSYGNDVVISHGNGNSTLYAHMSSMAVSSGQTVTKGQTIGYVGSTGWSTGAHCHFEIKIGGSLTDPMNYF